MAARKAPKKPAASRKRPAAFNAAAKRIFLDHLAQTSNISSSARKAGITTSRIYALCRKSPDFQQKFREALSQGYVRIEALLLQEAMVDATGNIKDSTLKARAQKQRVRLALLGHHRASVKEYMEEKGESGKRAKTEQMRTELVARLNLMRERLASQRGVIILDIPTHSLMMNP